MPLLCLTPVPLFCGWQSPNSQSNFSQSSLSKVKYLRSNQSINFGSFRGNLVFYAALFLSLVFSQGGSKPGPLSHQRRVRKPGTLLGLNVRLHLRSVLSHHHIGEIFYFFDAFFAQSTCTELVQSQLVLRLDIPRHRLKSPQRSHRLQGLSLVLRRLGLRR